MDMHDYARRMPKVELHVHLEGSIKPGTLLELAHRNNIALPALDLDQQQDYFHVRGFDQFLMLYITATNCLRTPADYHLITYEFGSECARQNIRYAEVTFTMLTNMSLSNLPWQVILNGLNLGREQARKDFGVELRWIFDIVRNLPDTQNGVLEVALAARQQGCVALGLGGGEAGFPPQLFAQTFDLAYQAGLACVPHAGEFAGPPSVWQALDLLHPQRLEHGVRSIEDPRLVETLAKRQIALDICPTSNIRLGVYPDFTAHPLRRLWEAGALITINTDDPSMVGTDLNQEYQVLVDHFGFGADELDQFSLNGVRASLLPDIDKVRLEAEFRAEFARLRKEWAVAK